MTDERSERGIIIIPLIFVVVTLNSSHRRLKTVFEPASSINCFMFCYYYYSRHNEFNEFNRYDKHIIHSPFEVEN